MKKAMTWLTQNEIEFNFHDYRKDGLEKEFISQWIAEFGWEKIINKRGTTWRALDEGTKNNMNDAQAIEDFRVSYAGKKGILNSLFASFREVPADEKKAFGQELNILKAAVADKVKELQSQQLSSNGGSARISDPTRTPFPIQTGNRHPLSVVKNRIIDIFLHAT